MQIKPLKLKGSFEIRLQPRVDERGFFMRTYDQQLFADKGIDHAWVQENHAMSRQQYTLRGLHIQLPPFAETKLLRCIKGAVLDVFVDLREGSDTFAQWDSIRLCEEEKNMVLVPRGFAHGYLSLDDDCEVCYKVDNVYQAEYERAIRWNDPDLNIDWGIDEPLLSEKDHNAASLQEYLAAMKTVKS